MKYFRDGLDPRRESNYLSASMTVESCVLVGEFQSLHGVPSENGKKALYLSNGSSSVRVNCC
jgi:hypothetical protein